MLEISAERSSTLILPLPIDLLTPFVKNLAEADKS
jgi:hypothetical protein